MGIRKADFDGTRQRRVATDADHEKISREMDEAFMWNVTRNGEIQRTLKHLRDTNQNVSSAQRRRVIDEITAKYRMLVSAARSSPANDRVM